MLAGDIVCFFAALAAALLLRSGGDLESETFFAHFAPFSILFLAWIGVFFIFDLYRPQTTLFKQKLPGTIFQAQLVNSFIAFLFFYLIPYFGITPKTILFIDLIVSFVFVWAWRRHLATNLAFRRKRKIFFACNGEDVSELVLEVKSNSSYRLEVVDSAPHPDQATGMIVVFNQYDASLESRQKLYPLLVSGATFVSVFDLYEEVFGRVPMGLINEEWCLENISAHPKLVYDFLKRVMDIVLSVILLIITSPFYLLVWLVMKVSDRGAFLSVQTRVGQKNNSVVLYKFRTMTIANDSGQWGSVENKITKLGAMLRKTRIDELPQVFSVLRGDLSLIGPRPEFAKAVGEYAEAIPFYNLRHIIKPGLSGWAQMYHDLHPHHGVDIVETRNKLSYDLYYIKNRSLVLDLAIALRTVKTLLSIAGR